LEKKGVGIYSKTKNSKVNKKMDKTTEPLDKLDKQIIDLLQTGGYCLPQANKIASKLHKSKSTIFDRIKKLETSGILRKYVPLVDSRKAGFDITAFAFARIKPGVKTEEAAKKLLKIPNIQEIHYLIGEWDLLIKFKVKNMTSYYETSTSEYIGIPEIVAWKGIASPRTFKEEQTLDLDKE